MQSCARCSACYCHSVLSMARMPAIAMHAVLIAISHSSNENLHDQSAHQLCTPSLPQEVYKCCMDEWNLNYQHCTLERCFHISSLFCTYTCRVWLQTLAVVPSSSILYRLQPATKTECMAQTTVARLQASTITCSMCMRRTSC